MMFTAELFGDGVFTGVTSLIYAVLAALHLSYPAATSILVGTLPHMQASGRPLGLEITTLGTTELPFFTKPNTQYSFL